MISRLMRNPGVREYWLEWGQNTFAKDFANEVDSILELATDVSSEEPGIIPFYMP